MKKICIALAACATLGMSFAAAANNHSVTLGYAYGKVEQIKLKGLNAKYRLEWDSPVSAIISGTMMTSSHDGVFNTGNKVIDGYVNDNTRDPKLELDHKSLSIGPAYRFNEFVSIYGLVGYSVTSGKVSATAVKPLNDYKIEQDLGKVKGVTYGAGLQFNPLNNVVIDVGYQGMNASHGKNNFKMNGFNAGVGYRF